MIQKLKLARIRRAFLERADGDNWTKKELDEHFKQSLKEEELDVHDAKLLFLLASGYIEDR